MDNQIPTVTLVGMRGCSYCESTAGVMSCPYHGPNASAMNQSGGTGGVAAAWAIHPHVWRTDMVTEFYAIQTCQLPNCGAVRRHKLLGVP